MVDAMKKMEDELQNTLMSIKRSYEEFATSDRSVRSVNSNYSNNIDDENNNEGFEYY